MKINEVEINNFYSFTKAVVKFDQYKGIVLINGKNKDTGGSNGSGKSAIVESVVWGIFGRTIRKSTEAALINNTAKKKCMVRIRLDDDYVIERGKKPVYLKFFHKDKELTQENATKTQELIEETLRTNYKVFLASTVFGQQNNIEFINATPDDKRTIIKNFLNLDELFDLRDSVKYLKSEYSQEIKKCDTIISENQKYVDGFDSKIANLQKIRKEIEESNLSSALKYSLDDIMGIEQRNGDLQYEIAHQMRSLESCKGKVSDLEKKLNGPKEKKCYACGHKVSVEINESSMKKEIESYTKEIKGLEGSIEELKASFEDAPVSSRDYHKVSHYQSLLKESETYEGLKKEALESIQNAYDTKQTMNSRYEIMRFWEKAFSESGLVKYIIKNVLDYFNARVNFYLSHLSQGKFFVEFDEQLSETIRHNGSEIHYISLSGGEKRKISLSVMLGLQELLKISHSDENSIMFFDEVAESLDYDGVSGLYDLLKELKQSRTLFVITHNPDLQQRLADCPVLQVEKKSGVSKLR